MKAVKFLLAIFTVAVVMASCASTQGGYDDGYADNTRRIGNRVYVDDPYYGQVVLERDPFTGRYYDVTYGYRGYGSPYNGYNRYRGGGGYYRNYPVYRNNNGVGSTIPRPVPNQRPQITEKTRQEAREKILDKKN